MIVPMKKYSFLVYHKELGSFLTDLQNLGVLHIIETAEPDEKMHNYNSQLTQLETVLKFLNKRSKKIAADKIQPDQLTESENGRAVFEKVVKLQSEYEQISQRLLVLDKDIKQWQPWGEFTDSDQERVRSSGLTMRFYQANVDKLTDDFKAKYALEIIYQSGKSASFVIFNQAGENNYPDFEEIKLPEKSLSLCQAEQSQLNARKIQIDKLVDSYAFYAAGAVLQTKDELLNLSELDRAALNSLSASEDLVRVLQGWVPEEKEAELQKYLDSNGLVYLSEKPEAEEYGKVPVLLKNNAFSRLFEPIGKLFSLPAYAELDLTPLFAPFFMLFFGLCLGDSGYGIAMVVGAAIAKIKLDKKMKPMLTLVQLLGVSTIFGGALSGTFFGVNLALEGSIVGEDIRKLFLSSQTMFYLAIAIGFVQVIFGQIVKCFNITKQNKFSASLSTIGWIIMELSMVLFAFPELKPVGMIMVYIGLAMALLFSTTGNIFKRIGLGLWDMYNNITGVFGDLLSYIRLFALGISGSILGMVINNIGGIFQDIPYVGWLIWIVFLVAGHTGNLLLCSLGAFVHPMRLTFVEFYKNSGWTGGGKDYRPFAKKIRTEH
jgi:V/A-type H+/Na+-transporting ATPase subunit I